MKTLRDMVFDTLVADSQLTAITTAAGIFPNFAAASPNNTLKRWMILRWGSTENAAGRDSTARPIALTVAVYNREPDFALIEQALLRTRAVLRALEGQRYENGAVLGVDDPTAVDDGYDDGYSAVVRSEVYRIVASGI